jgi:alpha-beta hydrolase superfamily lysophospholipase
MKLRLASAVVLFACSASSCMSLNAFLYASTSLDAYTFPYGDPWPADRRVPTDDRSDQIHVASDGTHVALVLARQPGSAMRSAPTVIYHHGQSDNIDRYWERASLIWSLGANVVAYDYPSYGRTPGTPSESTVYATARAALEYVHSLAIDQTRIFHYGFSMGSGPATEMAATTGPTRGLILESAFTSIDALVADGTLLVPRSFVVNNSFNNLSKIRRAATNTQLGVLLFHGDSDTYVQTRYGIELDAEIASGEAVGTLPAPIPVGRHQLFLIPGADHGEVPCVPPGDDPCHLRVLVNPTDTYVTQLRAFLMR